MSDVSTTRWTVTVSKETDIAVRSFLARRGLKKGDLSKFIEDAVKQRVLDLTRAETQRPADRSTEEPQRTRQTITRT